MLSGPWPSGQIKTLRVGQSILNGKAGSEAIFPPSSSGITDHQAVDHYCHVGWKLKPVSRESMTCFHFPLCGLNFTLYTHTVEGTSGLYCLF